MEASRSLPKIAEAHLEFPDLEEVPLPSNTKPVPVKKVIGPSMAKTRFNRMAFRVLANIIDSKEDEEEAEDETDSVLATNEEVYNEDSLKDAKNVVTDRNPPEKVSEKTVRSRPGSTTSLATFDGCASSKGKGSKGRKVGGSFMSLIRLASYRKRMSVKRGKQRSASFSSPVDETEKEEDHIKELPSHPRFCATLSTEAQYAMLKCYEDVLLDNIRSNKPMESAAENATLFRVKTPHDGLRTIHLAGGKDRSDVLHGGVVDGNPASRQFSIDGQGSARGSVRLPNIIPSAASPVPTHSSTGFVGSSRFPAVSKEKQLRLSYRFQTAMNILDALRDSKGQLITSPRSMKLGEINPVKNYNTWSKGWSKEFQYEYRTKGPDGSMRT